VRRRAPAPGSGSVAVPEALFDYRHPAWTSHQSARAWCKQHGVSQDVIRVRLVKGSGHERQWRRGDALRGWAAVNGYMSPRWPSFPDGHRLKALGLVLAGSPTGPQYRPAD
jgi:hypothetical protein